MKFARYVSFIVLSLVCFSQTVFASDFSDKVISNTNTEITHAQTIFDTEKESHTFIVANSNSELSQISQRKKVDLGNSNFFTANNIFYINKAVFAMQKPPPFDLRMKLDSHEFSDKKHRNSN